jgi:mRNA interferase RelE/StbE
LVWSIRFRASARRDLERLGPEAQRQILRFLRERIATDDDPGRFGKPLRGKLHGIWRYRVRHWRILCRIEKDRLVVLVIAVGDRRDVYR